MKAARAILALLMLAGCSQPAPQGAADTAAAREQSAVAPLKVQYKPVITGFDVKGTTFDIFVDAELMSEMDGPVEQAMEDQALKRWRDAWKSNNPGKHATLHVRFRNYFGEDVYTESAKV
jgi:hypothetical protein